MDVQAYGFSYVPPATVTVQEVLAEVRQYHKDKKKWNGQFRLISFLNRLDRNGLYRGGILSVRDEKVALRLMEVDGEMKISPADVNGEQVDFNCFLLKLDQANPARMVRGIYTAYFGSLSILAWGHLLGFFAREAVKKKLENLLLSQGLPNGARAISKYIEDHSVETEGRFSQIVVANNFEQMIRLLSVVKRIFLHYEVVSSHDNPDTPLSDVTETIRDSRSISLAAGTRGSAVAHRIAEYIQSVGATSGKAVGVKADGSEDEVDFFLNPERFWKSDLDDIKRTMNITVENFASSPIFLTLSRQFHDDPRLS